MWKPAKFVSILLWVLAIVSVLICIYVFVQAGSLNAKVPEERMQMMGVLEPMFIWAYILIALAIFAAIILPIPALLKNPRGLKGIVFGILGFGAVILVAWLLSNGDPLPFTPGHAPVSEGEIKFADMNIISIYIMFTLTVLALIGSTIVSKLRSR